MLFAKPPPFPPRRGRAGTGSACETESQSGMLYPLRFEEKPREVARQTNPSVESELEAERRRGVLERHLERG